MCGKRVCNTWEKGPQYVEHLDIAGRVDTGLSLFRSAKFLYENEETHPNT